MLMEFRSSFDRKLRIEKDSPLLETPAINSPEALTCVIVQKSLGALKVIPTHPSTHSCSWGDYHEDDNICTNGNLKISCFTFCSN